MVSAMLAVSHHLITVLTEGNRNSVADPLNAGDASRGTLCGSALAFGGNLPVEKCGALDD
jgi:hypothetical protein